MESLAESMPQQESLPRFGDGSINLRELMRSLAEDVINAVMDAEADQLCAGGANSRNGYRERNLVTCVGDITMRIPKLRTGSFFPEDVIERYQRVDRAVVAAVAEMYATGTSTRKVQRVSEITVQVRRRNVRRKRRRRPHAHACTRKQDRRCYFCPCSKTAVSYGQIHRVHSASWPRHR